MIRIFPGMVLSGALIFGFVSGVCASQTGNREEVRAGPSATAVSVEQDIDGEIRRLRTVLRDDDLGVALGASDELRAFGSRAKPAIPELIDLLTRLEQRELHLLQTDGFVSGPTGVLAVRNVIRHIDPASVPPCSEGIPPMHCEYQGPALREPAD